MHSLQVPTRHLDTNKQIRHYTCTFKFVIEGFCIHMKTMCAATGFTGDTVKVATCESELNWPVESLWCPEAPQWRSSIPSPPDAASRHSDLRPRTRPPAALWQQRSFESAAIGSLTECVQSLTLNLNILKTPWTCSLRVFASTLPLTVRALRWRQRQVWECVVMRRKSLQTAKEETLEASWERNGQKWKYTQH